MSTDPNDQSQSMRGLRSWGGPINILIDEENFKALVAGKIVCTKDHAGQPVNMILADIGWNRMLTAIYGAMQAQKEGRSKYDV